jgi:diacylglycerol O-acyltransferase / wax synthase
VSGYYERLSFLDSSFLALETRTTHMHVAGVARLEADPLRTEDGGIDIDTIRRYIESRLHLVPRYRQRLARIPLERYPVWVDDEHFNIDYHVRHTALPRPGNERQLKRLVGRISSHQLDRAKPLWELWVVEGLEDDTFAMISKIHHCMIDGIAGVDLLAVLLDWAPTTEIEDAPPYEPRPEPSGAELVLRETARRAGRAVGTLRSARRLVEDTRRVAFDTARRVRAVGYSLASGWLRPATRTPINEEIGPNRRFDTLGIDLDRIKAVKNALGGSVNDVVLATVTGAVRRFLTEDRGFAVDDIEFRAMAPVSVRSEDQRGQMGNQVAMWLVTLPIAEPDPMEQLRLVREETLKLKTTDQAYGAATLVQLSAGTPITLVSLATRLAANARPFNITVTNVPGPQFPLYLLGSKLLVQYPLVPLWEYHGVGIALFSYDGVVSWGFNADRDVMFDLHDFVRQVEAAFEELASLAAAAIADAASGQDAAPPKRRSTKKT